MMEHSDNELCNLFKKTAADLGKAVCKKEIRKK
jgi:hypothetical protein